MKKNLKFQLLNMFSSPGFITVIIFATVFAVICFLINAVPFLDYDVIDLPPAYTQYMGNGVNSMITRVIRIVFPLLSCFAFSDSFLADFKNNSLAAILARSDAKKYYYSKLIAVFIGGFAVLFFMQILNLLLCLVAFPLDSTNQYTWDLWQSDIYTVTITDPAFLFKGLYIISPYLYILFYMLISSIASALVAVIAFQISFIVQNRILVLAFMFVAVNLVGAFCSSRGIPLDIGSYMFGYTFDGQTYAGFALTLIIYAALAFLPSFFATKRLKNCI